MPFIDDELLWCPDNDGKMVDLTQCLQVSPSSGMLRIWKVSKIYHFSLRELSEFLRTHTLAEKQRSNRIHAGGD